MTRAARTSSPRRGLAVTRKRGLIAPVRLTTQDQPVVEIVVQEVTHQRVAGQERIILRWNKTRWRCRQDYCERGSFAESIAQVPARARTTGRLRTQIGAAIGDAARSVPEVAAAQGVSSQNAHRAIITHSEWS